MTKEARISKSVTTRLNQRAMHWIFGFRNSFVIRHSDFVIFHWHLWPVVLRFVRDASSRKDVRNHFAMDVGETPVGATVAERQFLVIDSQQVQHRRMEVISRRGRLR